MWKLSLFFQARDRQQEVSALGLLSYTPFLLNAPCFTSLQRNSAHNTSKGQLFPTSLSSYKPCSRSENGKVIENEEGKPSDDCRTAAVERNIEVLCFSRAERGPHTCNISHHCPDARSSQSCCMLCPVLRLHTTFSGRNSSHKLSICPDVLCSSRIHMPSTALIF